MRHWIDRLSFLWEEEAAPPQEVPRPTREEPAGVPRLLRRATRFALVSVMATSLMGQVIGIRLIAPVDAAPGHVAQCQQACNNAFTTCTATCANGNAGKACRDACQTTKTACNTSCSQ
jgi:hypothetical protein